MRSKSKTTPVVLALSALAGLVLNITAIYVCFQFTFWILDGGLGYGILIGFLVWSIGMSSLLPVTLWLFPIYCGQLWLTIILMIAYPMSVPANGTIDHPSQVQGWPTWGSLIALIYYYGIA
jgi:hypothetical protein